MTSTLRPLVAEFGPGFEEKNLRRMQFAEAFLRRVD